MTETTRETIERAIEPLKDPDLLLNIIREVHKQHVGEYDSIIAMVCQVTTRLVKDVEPESQNLTITGEPGSGKDRLSAVVYTIMVGNDKYFHLSKLSPEALTYFHSKDKKWTWDEKVIVIEDPTPEVINCQTVKTFLSGKGKTGLVAKKQKTDEIKVNGKPVFIVTTAKSEGEHELIRRLPCIALDESHKLTKQIKKFQALRAMGKLVNINQNKQLIDALHQLKPCEVVVPYADRLVDLLPDTTLMRTYFQRFLDYIKASTVLYQYQRETDKDGRLIATAEDYDMARVTMIKTISNKEMIPLNSEQQRVLDHLIKENKFQFPYDIRDALGITKDFLDNTLIAFKRHELVETKSMVNEKANNRVTSAYRIKIFTNMTIPTWLTVGESWLSRESDSNTPISRREIVKEFWSSACVGICISIPELWQRYYDLNKTLYERDKSGASLENTTTTITNSYSTTSTPSQQKEQVAKATQPLLTSTQPLSQFDKVNKLRTFIDEKNGIRKITLDFLYEEFGKDFIDKLIDNETIIKNALGEYEFM